MTGLGQRVRHAKRRAVHSYRVGRLASTRLLAAFARELPEAAFVQVGSNDGEQLDPLRRHILRRRWRGVMVEPVPHVFARLRSNYGHLSDRIALENVAIADRHGELPFHHLAPVADHEAEGLPRWYDALGSFRREIVLKHQEFIPDIEARLVTTPVPCLPFDELCDRHALHDLDLLHIDTEGYDFELLKTIDWSRHRPALVIYEHLHLTGAERAACLGLLADVGYGAIEENMDTFCLHLGAERSGPRLVRLFERLRRAQ